MPIARPTTTFTGAPTDQNRSVYLNARYLDPATVTFLTRDPLRATAATAVLTRPTLWCGFISEYMLDKLAHLLIMLSLPKDFVTGTVDPNKG
ncbi:MAG: hypothetical protein ABI947_22240 [Chloroflexota bacterium]